MELRRIIGNTFFIVLGFLSGCGFDTPQPEPARPVEVIETREWDAEDIDLHVFDGGKLDDFESIGIPKG